MKGKKHKTPGMIKTEEKIGESLDEFLKREYAERKRSAPELAGFFGVHHATVYSWLEQYNITRRDKPTAQSLAKLPAGVVKPSKAQLREWYIVEGQSTYQIGERFGISEVTVSKWIKNYNLRIRSPGERQLPHGFIKPSKLELKKLYIAEKKDCYEIAGQFGVTPTTIRSWLIRNGIKVRSNSEAKLLKVGAEKPSRDELRQLYIVERMTSYQIGERYGVTQRTVLNWMSSYDLRTRDVRESKLPEGVKRPSQKELERMHLEDLSSTVHIAKKMGVKSSSTIQRWMKEYGIPTQPFDAQLARKKVVDELLDSAEKTPEQLTTTDFYRGKNRPKGILRV